MILGQIFKFFLKFVYSQFGPIIMFVDKNEKSKDYCKADLKQRVLFFIRIFWLAIPAFFRFTDVTELI